MGGVFNKDRIYKVEEFLNESLRGWLNVAIIYSWMELFC